MPFPLVALLVQSRVPYSTAAKPGWLSVAWTGEKIHVAQSAAKRDDVLNLSSPPTTGIATPGFAGFWKSGL